MLTDSALLVRFARERDHSAFAELARRHMDLVYSSAARRVGDRHLAEDITQAVFMILARKPFSAARTSPLSAWLLNTVRYATANALKTERRRLHHHALAARQASASTACSPNPSDVLVWQEVAAHVDDAVLALPARDRQAVLLRYFQDKSINDVAAAMNSTEGAVKQRLNRSIEKLRRKLTRRGAVLGAEGAAGLSALLAEHILRAAPARVLSGISAACTSASSASAASLAITKGAIAMMTWTKIKAIAAVVLLAFAVGGGVVVTTRLVGAQGLKQNVAQAAPPAGTEADKLTARVTAAQEVVDALQRREQEREPLTPTFIELRAVSRRRLAEAQIEATNDPAARLRIAQQYAKESRDYLQVLINRMMARTDVSSLQVAQWKYHLADAEYLLAKLQNAR